MDHPTADELRLVLDGGLPPDRAGWVDTHVARCSVCRGVLDALTAEAGDAWLPPRPSAPVEPPAWPVVPGFDLEAVVGRGGQGVVFRARNRALRRTVALKVVRDDWASDPAARRRFRANALALAALAHPHVVDVYSAGEGDGFAFVEMELVPGGSLAARAAGRPLPERVAAAVVRDAARGVQHAHDRGLVHRDLKPSNVLLAGVPTGDGDPDWAACRPQVADFGTAKGVPDSQPTPTQAIVGTPGYMAPEVARGGAKAADPRTDVYGLGAVLYELLTGGPPFHGATPFETLDAVCRFPPVPPRDRRPGLSRDLDTVCLKCLEKDPAHRYQTAAAVADDLDRFLAGKPVLARPLGALRRAARWTRRHPTAAGLVVSLTLLAVAVTTGSVLAARAAREQAEQEQTLSELLLAVGSQREAVARIDRLAADGRPLPARLRLLRVDALIELGEYDRAADELDRLTLDDLPPDARGRALLRRADLCLVADEPKALALVRDARAAGLAADDAAFADALEAADTPAAVRHLERAVGLNSRHVQARCMLCYLLLLGGRLDEAGRRADEARLLFADHPAFPLVLAVGRGLLGEADRADAALAALESVRPADEVRLVRDLVGALPLLRQELRHRLYGRLFAPRPLPDADRERLLDVCRRVGRLAPELVRETRLPFAVRPAVADMLRTLFRLLGYGADGEPLTADERTIPADQLDAFGRTFDRHPEAVTGMLYGTGLLEAANAPTPSVTPEVDLKRYRAAVARAADAYARAADRPGWVDVRDVALERAAVCYSMAGKPRRPFPYEVNRGWVDRGAEYARRRWVLGPAQPIVAGYLIKVAAAGDRFPLARLMLDDLERAGEDRMAVERLRADLEFKAGDRAAALAAAKRVLEAKPDDEAMKTIRDACEKEGK